MTLTFDALYAGDILDFSHPEMFGERGYDMGSCDGYMQQPTPHVRMASVHIRMEERELYDVYDAEMQGNNGGSRVWATVRTVTVGGLAGLIFVAGVWFASSKEDTVSDSAITDAKITVRSHQ